MPDKVYLVLDQEPGHPDCLLAASLDRALAEKLMREFLEETKERWQAVRIYRDDPCVSDGKTDGDLVAFHCTSKYTDSPATCPGWWVTLMLRNLDEAPVTLTEEHDKIDAMFAALQPDDDECATTLELQPDVAAMNIPSDIANEILRYLYRPGGVVCDAKWMRTVVERDQGNDREF